MNIELAEKVLAHIKKHEDAFCIDSTIEQDCYDYQIPNYPCGTTCCIAGWTVLLSEQRAISSDEIENDFGKRSWHRVKTQAKKLLEISELEANYLFMPIDDLGEEMNDGEAIARFEGFIKDKIKEGFKD